MKTVLSVDVAKNKSMIMLMNSDGEILIDTKEIKHNLEDFEKAKEEIKEINPENLTVFMESTGTYHLPVERYFKENGFNTLVINSLTTKNNYDTIRKTKTDKKDCYRLAKLFFVNEVEYHELSKKDLYANLKAMTRQYFYLLQQNVSCKNRYKRLLNICFPELEKIFKSTRIYDDTALNFIKEFPHAEIVKEKRIDALYNNLYKTNGRNLNFYKRLSETIKIASANSYPGVDKEHKDVKYLSDMSKIVQNNNNVINELRDKIGLYSIGTHTDSLTLKAIGTTGFGYANDNSYTYTEYTFVDSKNNEYEMKYINNGDTLDLTEGQKYHVTFEVSEGTFDYEFTIKSIN